MKKLREDYELPVSISEWEWKYELVT